MANDGIQLTKLLTQKIFLKANDVRVAKVMLFQDKIFSPKMRLYVYVLGPRSLQKSFLIWLLETEVRGDFNIHGMKTSENNFQQ